MKYYTNNRLKGTTDLQGTATISLGEDITGKFSGKVLKKGTEIVVSVSYTHLTLPTKA